MSTPRRDVEKVLSGNHGEDEYFVLEGSGEGRILTDFHEDAEMARAHALSTGGKLFRGRTEVVWESMQEIPLNADDAY